LTDCRRDIVDEVGRPSDPVKHERRPLRLPHGDLNVPKGKGGGTDHYRLQKQG